MKHYRALLALAVLLLSTGLASCSPGHNGSNEIAFIRDGQLWTIDPNGANAYAIVAQNTPVVSYGWSPTHQVLAFRALDQDYAKSAAARQMASNAMASAIGDVPGSLNTIGIDGGSPITIMFSDSDTLFSHPLWNSSGTRLIYRQEPRGSTHPAGSSYWWAAQNDQPGGIATKLLPTSYSIPSLSYTEKLAVGNSSKGLFTVALDGTHQRYLTPTRLLGHPLPATLERVLWQPAHEHPLLLYAIPVNQEHPLPVRLDLYNVDNSSIRTVATCNCAQFAWSPDGSAILYSTGSTYTVIPLNNQPPFTFTGESGSVPSWSPDSKLLLLDGPHTLTLINVSQRQQQVLLRDDAASAAKNSSGDQASSLSSTSDLLQPAANSPWAADSYHFLFLTRDRLNWLGHALKSGRGLYTAALNDQGLPQGTPTATDTGHSDTQAGWTYQDPNTSFLY